MLADKRAFCLSSKVFPTTASWRRDCSPSFFVCGRRNTYTDSVANVVRRRPRLRKKNSNMQVPIGQLIRDELRRQGKTNQWLASQIHVNPRTINKIFQKEVIDTNQLFLISKVLNVDFFKAYSEELR